MAKTKNGFFSATARGAVGPILIENLRNTQYVRMKTKIKDKKSPSQMEQRKKYGEIVQAWRSLTPQQKKDLNQEAKPFKMSGFNLFVREYKPFPIVAIYGVGIYGLNAYGN